MWTDRNYKVIELHIPETAFNVFLVIVIKARQLNLKHILFF
jgi:hypothetical protein